MALAGNLTDLTLIELLQTVSLSRKSGVLKLECDGAQAWLGLSAGGIVRVALPGSPFDRKLVLAAAGLEPDAPDEQIEACLWQAAVDATLRLFVWHQGTFTFDGEADPVGDWGASEGLRLREPISPDFLALEGARREDEARAEDRWVAADDSADPLPPAEEATRLAPEAAQGATSEVTLGGPVVLIDSDIALLEAIRSGLAHTGVPVHMMHRTADGFDRIKHYVLRGQVPSLVLSERVARAEQRYEDRLEQFVERVRRMSPSVRIVVLRDEPGAKLELAEAEVVRCAPGDCEKAAFERFVASVASALGACR